MPEVLPEAYHADRVYLGALERVLHEGVRREDRTGTGTVSLFGTQERYSLQEGFPLLTSKKLYTRGIFSELLWLLRGETNVRRLQEERVHIWDAWADEEGELGPVYGKQWRSWQTPEGGEVDQVLAVLQGLREDPYSRRHIITAWNPGELPLMALPPCHLLFQFYVTPDSEGRPWGLSCHLYQRSKDNFLGSPFNIASYSALTQLFAELVGLVPLEFIHSTGDSHIYLNHLEQVREQLSRRERLPASPTLTIHHPVAPALVDLTDPLLFHRYKLEDFQVEGYRPLPALKGAVAV